jgi:hypothetical protein
MSDNIIDFNSSEFESSGPVLIFNGGEAGIVECVTEKIVAKTAEDKEQSPDFKLYFRDAEGASINMAIYYIDKNLEAKDYSNRVNKLGKRLRDLWIALMGKDNPIPRNSDVNLVIKNIMDILTPRFATEIPVRIAVNYGTTVAPKKYLQVRNWSPFIENIALVPEAKLERAKIEVYERVTEDDSPFGDTPSSPSSPTGGNLV